MSAFHSDKCTKEELSIFKNDVLMWLNNNFDISEVKIRALTCYNGDIRLYTGEVNEFTNQRSSFRREYPNKDKDGNIIGWHGTRGIHTTRYREYISINRDEFDEIKKALETKDEFYWDYMFRKLKPLTQSPTK